MLSEKYGRWPARKAGNYRRKKSSRYNNRKWYGSRKMTGYMGTAFAALTLAQKLKNMINVEYKFHDKDLNDYSTLVEAGELQCLNEIPQGDDNFQRNGNQVKIKQTEIRGSIKASVDATDSTQVRLLLFQKLFQDDTDPTVTGTDVGILEDANVNSLKTQTATKTTFKILWDQTWVLSPMDQTNGRINYKYFKKWDNGPKCYFVRSGTAAPKKNGLWLLAIASQPTNLPIMKGECRIRFVDN